jgi:hypothetical protein
MKNPIILEQGGDSSGVISNINSATVRFETASPSKMPKIYESTHFEKSLANQP